MIINPSFDKLLSTLPFPWNMPGARWQPPSLKWQHGEHSPVGTLGSMLEGAWAQCPLFQSCCLYTGWVCLCICTAMAVNRDTQPASRWAWFSLGQVSVLPDSKILNSAVSPVSKRLSHKWAPISLGCWWQKSLSFCHFSSKGTQNQRTEPRVPLQGLSRARQIYITQSGNWFCYSVPGFWFRSHAVLKLRLHFFHARLNKVNEAFLLSCF